MIQIQKYGLMLTKVLLNTEYFVKSINTLAIVLWSECEGKLLKKRKTTKDVQRQTQHGTCLAEKVKNNFPLPTMVWPSRFLEASTPSVNKILS